MDANLPQAPMAAVMVSAAKKTFRKMVKEVLKGLEQESVGLQCKLAQVLKLDTDILHPEQTNRCPDTYIPNGYFCIHLPNKFTIYSGLTVYCIF